MTRRTFYRKLKKFSSNRTWTNHNDKIRAETESGALLCPIEDVASYINKNSFNWNNCGKEMGLSWDDKVAIVQAADNHGHSSTRRALLRAVGLE